MKHYWCCTALIAVILIVGFGLAGGRWSKIIGAAALAGVLGQSTAGALVMKGRK